MPTFREYKPKNEKELHQLIENELDSLEEGLEIIQHEMNLGGQIPDFLCVDSGSRITIIEVKLKEDENVLFQGLRYYSKVDANGYAIANIAQNQKVEKRLWYLYPIQEGKEAHKKEDICI